MYEENFYQIPMNEGILRNIKDGIDLAYRMHKDIEYEKNPLVKIKNGIKHFAIGAKDSWNMDKILPKD